MTSHNDVRVTLAYTDLAADPYAIATVINVLRISVIDMDTNEIYLSLTEKSNIINNVAMIIVPSPQPNSAFKISVTAVSISSLQPYALVVTSKITKLNPDAIEKKPLIFLFFTLPPAIYFLISMGTMMSLGFLFFIHTREWKHHYRSLDRRMLHENLLLSNASSSSIIEVASREVSSTLVTTNRFEERTVIVSHMEGAAIDVSGNRQLAAVISGDQGLPV